MPTGPPAPKKIIYYFFVGDASSHSKKMRRRGRDPRRPPFVAGTGERPPAARAHLLRERTRPAGASYPPAPAGVGVVFSTRKMRRRGRDPRRPPFVAGTPGRPASGRIIPVGLLNKKCGDHPAPHLLRERTRPAGGFFHNKKCGGGGEKSPEKWRTGGKNAAGWEIGYKKITRKFQKGIAICGGVWYNTVV